MGPSRDNPATQKVVYSLRFTLLPRYLASYSIQAPLGHTYSVCTVNSLNSITSSMATRPCYTDDDMCVCVCVCDANTNFPIDIDEAYLHLVYTQSLP